MRSWHDPLGIAESHRISARATYTLIKNVKYMRHNDDFNDVYAVAGSLVRYTDERFDKMIIDKNNTHTHR